MLILPFYFLINKIIVFSNFNTQYSILEFVLFLNLRIKIIALKKNTCLLLFLLGLSIAPMSGVAQSKPSSLPIPSNKNIEDFISKLNAQHIFQSVKQKTGATKEELRLFYRFYEDSLIMPDKSEFTQYVLHGKINNDADIKSYARKKISEYVSMYWHFERLRKNAPAVVVDRLSHHPLPPITCDTGCNNFDFSSGTLAAWTACYAENTSVGTSSSSGGSGSFSNTAWTCFGPLTGGTESANDPSTSSYQVSLMSGGGNDAFAGAFLPLVPPGCTHSCRIGDSTNPGYGMAMIEQTFSVTAAQPFVNYYYAVLLENPSHPYYEQPYFWTVFLDQYGDTIPSCGRYFVVSGPGLAGFRSFYYPADLDTVYVRPWTYQYLSLRNYIGQCVSVHVIAADCSLGGHFGYGYFEGICGQYSLSATPVVCGSNDAILTAPGGAQSYQWSGPCIVGSTTSQSVTVSCPGTYSVAIIDNLTTPCPDTLTVTVTAGPPFYLDSVSSNNIICNGQNTGNITVLASGGTLPYTYSWSPANGTSATASGLTAGTYTVYAKDAGGCGDSLVYTITQPNAMVLTTSSTPTPCGSNAGTASVTISGGTPIYTYHWMPSGSSNSTATGLGTGNYTITVTDANGCTQTASTVVSTLTALNVTATSTSVNCNGSLGTAIASVTNGASPYTYTWSPSGGSNSTAAGLSAGTYTVTVLDANGCEGEASVTITQPNLINLTTSSTLTSCSSNTGTATVTAANGNSPYTYLWNPSGNTNATATGLSAGVYTVTVTDANGCISTASVSVQNPSTFTLSTTTTESTCSGNNGSATVAVVGGTPPFTYIWSPSGNTTANATGLSAGTYTVTVTDANGCSQTATAEVTSATYKPLSLGVTGTASICSGESANLSATATGGYGSYSFLWQPGSYFSENITVTPSVTTTYTIQLTDGCGSVVTDTVTVFVSPSPIVSFIANPRTGCAPLCIQFRNISTIASGSISRSVWSFGNGDTASGKDPIYCYNAAGTFNVSLTAISANGCSGSLNTVDMITVYQPPIASFTYSPQTVNILSPLVQFTDNSTSKYSIIYRYWTFGKGTDANSTEINPSFLYTDTGMYCATLLVEDNHGCVDSATNCLVVSPLFTLYIPDAFSPNGDGVNDIFMPKGSYIRDFDMYIFDRWGMELFHSTDIMNGWNGRVNSNSTVCQEDAYIYQISVTDPKGNKHSYTGTVNLLR
jgi:gliding motility-associated-like protein